MIWIIEHHKISTPRIIHIYQCTWLVLKKFRRKDYKIEKINNKCISFINSFSIPKYILLYCVLFTQFINSHLDTPTHACMFNMAESLPGQVIFGLWLRALRSHFSHDLNDISLVTLNTTMITDGLPHWKSMHIIINSHNWSALSTIIYLTNWHYLHSLYAQTISSEYNARSMVN